MDSNVEAVAAADSAPEKPRAISGRHIECLHTYFLFPFALDKLAIQEDHPQAWAGKTRWIDGVDAWIAGESGRRASQGMSLLGVWKRAGYSNFDIASPGYRDLLAFHSIVRQVFFDTNMGARADAQQNQLRCYTIDLSGDAHLYLEGHDSLGRGGRAAVNDLRLYVSADGIGILSIGVSTGPIDVDEALWINRRLRKLYAPDENSLRDGLTPNWMALRAEENGKSEILCEERFECQRMVGFYPPLSNIVKCLLYFADYAQEEYEPVLDENLLVYSYCAMDRGQFGGEDTDAGLDPTLDALLHLNHTRDIPAERVSDGSRALFGFTAHSCSIVNLLNSVVYSDGQSRFGILHSSEAANAEQAFHSRFYLMVIVALLYRTVLLDFSERSALVSRLLLEDQQAGKLMLPTITMVNDLRVTFLNFCSYWHFDDLSSKEGDNTLFRRLHTEYKIPEMKRVLADELRYMGEFVYNFYQLKATEAVNRLAMLSLIFGGGAVLTGFFGMNFGREFGRLFFEGEGVTPFIHYFMVATVCIFVFGSLLLGTFVLLRNWRDYAAILNPPKSQGARSIKRDL